MSQKLIIGIDEVGRGPLAGPVSIGIVLCRTDLRIEGLTDSKQMTEKERERVAQLAEEMQKTGEISYGIYSVPAGIIDTKGIEYALRSCITTGLNELAPDSALVKVFLDGRLKAPPEYAQESLIRGDSLVPAISLASVVAKVHRDDYMRRVAHKAFPGYGFDQHKGYGTEAHITAIKMHGVTPLHRTTFLRNIVVQ